MCAKSDHRKTRCESSWEPDPPSPFPPARLFCGCFSAFAELLAEVKPRLEAIGGPIIRASELLDFPETRAYAPTMGHDIKRIFYVFGGLCAQDCLAAVKKQTDRLEAEVRQQREWPVARPINLDPGIVTEGHVVLASTRDRGHRIPRADGIYEEITLLYFDGAFQPLFWTYEDFRRPACIAFFEEVRKDFLTETRSLRRRYQEAERDEKS
jgi:hypothetical protein